MSLIHTLLQVRQSTIIAHSQLSPTAPTCPTYPSPSKFLSQSVEKLNLLLFPCEKDVEEFETLLKLKSHLKRHVAERKADLEAEERKIAGSKGGNKTGSNSNSNKKEGNDVLMCKLALETITNDYTKIALAIRTMEDKMSDRLEDIYFNRKQNISAITENGDGEATPTTTTSPLAAVQIPVARSSPPPQKTPQPDPPQFEKYLMAKAQAEEAKRIVDGSGRNDNDGYNEKEIDANMSLTPRDIERVAQGLDEGEGEGEGEGEEGGGGGFSLSTRRLWGDGGGAAVESATAVLSPGRMRSPSIPIGILDKILSPAKKTRSTSPPSAKNEGDKGEPISPIQGKLRHEIDIEEGESSFEQKGEESASPPPPFLTPPLHHPPSPPSMSLSRGNNDITPKKNLFSPTVTKTKPPISPYPLRTPPPASKTNGKKLGTGGSSGKKRGARGSGGRRTVSPGGGLVRRTKTRPIDPPKPPSHSKFKKAMGKMKENRVGSENNARAYVTP